LHVRWYNFNDVILLRIVGNLHDDFTKFCFGQRRELDLLLVSSNRTLDHTACERKFNLSGSQFAEDESDKQVAIFVDLGLAWSVLKLQGVLFTW
jgi:hypothetical protein